jgi:putative transcriptional regulator
MTNRNLGKEIRQGLDEIRRFKAGEISLRTETLSEPCAPQIIRERLALSQDQFAGLLGVSVRTLQDWEQGRRRPQGPALALLRIAEQHPAVFLDLR